MKFTTSGPDIPDELIRKIEQGKVVFFCGAGLSYEQGFEDFNWLVNGIRKETATDQRLPDGIPENEVYKDKKYPHPDLFLNYLANSLGEDGHIKVKKAAIEAFNQANKDNQENKSTVSYESHKAILKLATTYKNHIVTTNFDHGFIKAQEELELSNLEINKAPTLPPATKEFLPRIVYLHGIIDKEKDPNGNSLVLTSKDFGFAYLKQGWATKFLTELFSNFTILFIGYSVNDPIVRYLVDIFSYEKALDAHVITSYSEENKNDRERIEKEWGYKGTNPILYLKEKESDKHLNLHETLRNMPEKINMQGRKHYISLHAQQAPDTLNQEDRNQLIWAIKDQTGEAIKYFTELEPTPHIKWLKYFEGSALTNDDKTCSGHYCSMTESLATKVALPDGCAKKQVNNFTNSLLPWIKKHLGNQDLLDYVLSQGCYLKREVKKLIQDELIEKQGTIVGIYQVWDILANKTELLPKQTDCTIFAPNKSVNQWLHLLTPYLEIRPAPKRDRTDQQTKTNNEPAIYHFASFNIIFPSIYGTCLDDIISDLKPLLEDTKLLSTQAFELTRLLTRVYEIKKLYSDTVSAYDRPSIIKNDQNNFRPIWTCLIDLLREAFIYLKDNNKEQAKTLATYWKTIDYPIFTRFVLFSMANSGVFTNKQILDYLPLNHCALLWNIDLKCERYELFEILKKRLKPDKWKLLLNEFIKSKKTFTGDDKEYLYWLLRDIKELGVEVQYPKKCSTFIEKYQDMEKEDWQKKLLSYTKSWKAGELSDYPTQHLMSMPISKLYKVLTEDVDPQQLKERLSALHEGLWHDINPAINLAEFLLQEKKWEDKDLWKLVFNRTRSEATWSKFSTKIQHLPDTLINSCLYQITGWFRDVTKKIDPDHEEEFWAFFEKLESLALQQDLESIEKNDNPYSEARNNSLGHITQALIDRLYARTHKEGGLIAPEIKGKISCLLRRDKNKFNMLAGVILSSNLYQLYLIDPQWTKDNIIVHMNCSEDKQIAKCLWIGVLYNPSYSVDLIKQLSAPLLSAIENKNIFTQKDNQSINFQEKLIEFYILSLLYSPEKFKEHSAQTTLATFTLKELEIVTFSLYHCIASSNNPDDAWKSNIHNWMKDNFSQNNEDKSEDITIHLIKILLLLEKQFHEAFSFLERYLSKMPNHAFDVFYSLEHSTHLKKNTKDCLDLLNIITDEEGRNAGLKNILTIIQNNDQTLSENSAFTTLSKIASTTDAP